MWNWKVQRPCEHTVWASWHTHTGIPFFLEMPFLSRHVTSHCSPSPPRGPLFCFSKFLLSLLLVFFMFILSFLCVLSLNFLPVLLLESILADSASAPSYAPFHRPLHRLSIHLAVAQERPGLPTSVTGIEVDGVQSNIRNVFQRDCLSVIVFGRHTWERPRGRLHNRREPSLHAPIRRSREVHEVVSTKSQIRCFNIRVG